MGCEYMRYDNAMQPISKSTHDSKASRRAFWLGLFVVLMIGLIIVITPIWLIMPFKPQTPRGLAISFAMKRTSPIVTIVAAALYLIICIRLWRGSRWFGKGLMVLLFVPLAAATWMSRQNHFEWLFHPYATIAYARPAEVDYVSDNDMVLAVNNNGESAAYPVRLMAYHHLVQDTVGGKAVVATY